MRNARIFKSPAVVAYIFFVTSLIYSVELSKKKCFVLPYLEVSMDNNYLPMPVVEGVSQTNRSDNYYISNTLYRAATTPEKFWLFMNEKTNLWVEAISNRNPKAALRLSQYYSFSMNDEKRALKWLAISLALGSKDAAGELEAMSSYCVMKNIMSTTFSLTSNQFNCLKYNSLNNEEWKSALRLALYYGFTQKNDTQKLYWLNKAEKYGSKGASGYLDLLKEKNMKK